MDSFEDISDFQPDLDGKSSSGMSSGTLSEVKSEIPFGQVSGNSPGTVSGISSHQPDNGDEDFTEFKLTNLTNTGVKQKDLREIAQTKSISRLSSDDVPAEDRDPWSHQDLSRFKVNLTPVSVDDDESGLSLDLNDEDLDSTQFVYRSETSGLTRKNSEPESKPRSSQEQQLQQQLQRFGQQTRQALQIDPGSIEIPPSEINFSLGTEFAQEDQNQEDQNNEISLPEYYRNVQSGVSATEGAPYEQLNEYNLDDSSHLSLEIETVEESNEQPLSIQPIDLSISERPDSARENLGMGRIPQLSAERLEEIIRSQSREIIESVVRRIVPDIAAALIKQELQRLLEETSVREQQGWENRR